MYKFRTMVDVYDENGEPLPDELRLGRFGKVLCVTSSDELPELFNILRDNMVIAGPHPLLVCYLPRYNAYQVCPGFTGLEQVNGRNSIS